jgi:hypothetical protein
LTLRLGTVCVLAHHQFMLYDSIQLLFDVAMSNSLRRIEDLHCNLHSLFVCMFYLPPCVEFK